MFAACLLLSGAAFAQAIPDTASGRFDALDANRDGVLSKYEYDSETVFAVLDGNHDDRISADELQVLLGPATEDRKTNAAARIAVADTNGDGAWEYDEITRGSEMRFKWMDANQDGNVDLAELQASFGVPMVRP
jgi:Ca2+-binding EF-hand superfamily protein